MRGLWTLQRLFRPRPPRLLRRNAEIRNRNAEVKSESVLTSAFWFLPPALHADSHHAHHAASAALLGTIGK
jgi:hypothetical protein